MNRIGVVKCPSPAGLESRRRVEWTRDALNHWIDEDHVTQICLFLNIGARNLKLFKRHEKMIRFIMKNILLSKNMCDM